MRLLQTALLLIVLSDCAATLPASLEPASTATAAACPPASGPAPAQEVDTSLLATLSVTRSFRLGRPEHISLTPDGRRAIFLRAESRDPTRALYMLDTATGQESQLLTAEVLLSGAQENLSVEERARRERMRISARGIVSYELSPDGRTLLVPLANKLFVFDLESRSTRELRLSTEEAPIDARFSPTGTSVAFARDHDLVVYDLTRNQEQVLTRHENAHIEWGQAEFVAQEEMDQMQGYWWSPDGAHLAVQRTDTSRLETFHIADPSRPEVASTDFPYPRAGKANADVQLFIVSVRGGRPLAVRWDRETYPYLARVVWPKGGQLTLLVQNRLQTEELLLSVDTRTGNTTTLLTERDTAWLNIDPTMPRFLPDGSFLWTTEQRGAWQLELHQPNGALVSQLTLPEHGYRKLIGLDADGSHAIIQASANPLEAQIQRVTIATTSTPPEPLTTIAGVHDAVVSSNSRVWIDDYESQSGVRRVVVNGVESGNTTVLRDVSEAPPFMPNVTWERVELEGRMHDAAIVRPRDFDEQRSYPVLVSVYGGPHHNSVTAQRYRYFGEQWFADHGFVVIAMDGRGTMHHGRLWERSIHRDVIATPLADQVAVLNALFARHAELDRSRVGIFGWSFGGYFTLHALMQRGDVFHAGVAGAPVNDWRDYDTHYTERYMGLPTENAEGYDRTMATTYAARLERPLLLIHGTADDNVYLVHSLKVVNALTRAGRSFEFLPLAGQTHMVTEPELVARYKERMVRFFRDRLGAPRAR